MSYYKIVLLSLLHFLPLLSNAQHRETAQKHIDILSSDSFSGRGYIDQGDLMAAQYIREEFKRLGLEDTEKDYFHAFDLDINTLPLTEVSIDGETLQAGYDYLVSPACPSVQLSKKLFPISAFLLHQKNIAKKVRKAVRKGMVPVFPVYDRNDSVALAAIEEIKACAKAPLLIFLKEGLTWSMSQKQSDIPELWLKASSFDPFAKHISISVEAELISPYHSQNVVGMIKGTDVPDSIIILCGHYDHLGQMGEAVFHGANDNASGIAMLLDMAAYFAENPQRYSILFVAFGGEEVGLLGSLAFVKDSTHADLIKRIKFVFNMDLMGSGEDGATLVNGSVFVNSFELFKSINDEKQYLSKIKARGKAANSDHYFFTELGIPSFFIYLMGEYTHYHIPEDRSENLRLTEYYDRSFNLIRDFILAINAVN